MFQFLLRNLVGAVVLALALCGGGTSLAADNQAMILPVDPQPLVVDTAGGKAVFQIEIADDSVKRSRGLMFRKSMTDDHGMLFVFENTRLVGFWMKNTILPLDLVFIGEDGRVKAVRQGEPLSEALIAPNDPVRFVLELTAGTAGKAGIGEGSLVHHPRIDTVDGLAN